MFTTTQRRRVDELTRSGRRRTPAEEQELRQLLDAVTTQPAPASANRGRVAAGRRVGRITAG